LLAEPWYDACALLDLAARKVQMQYPVAIIASVAMFFALGTRERLEIRDSFEFEPTAQTVRKIRWPKRRSKSLYRLRCSSPGLRTSNRIATSSAPRVAPSRAGPALRISTSSSRGLVDFRQSREAGDGVSLLTIAATPENEAFNSEATTGRTRVFFDPETGNIAEADISINPRPRAEMELSFSFPLTARPALTISKRPFTHEIGHLLGLGPLVSLVVDDAGTTGVQRHVRLAGDD
jgi:hypothetical protein